MKVIFVLNLIFSSYVFANIGLPYHPENDALCFINGDPELLEAGIPILGKLGVKEGVCQGMAGVTAAFLENAKFLPSIKTHDSAQEIHQLVHRLLVNHRFGIREQVIVNGSANIKEFCTKNKRELMRAAILYNTNIAINKISIHLPLLFTLKKNQLRGMQDQQLLLSHLQSIADTLSAGRYPLMLFFRHVVMITSFNETLLSSGERVIELSAYDSNQPDVVVSYHFLLRIDGLPAMNNYMIWKL